MRNRLFPACGVEKNGRKKYVHPDMWLSSLLSHSTFLSRSMVGSFSQRLGNGGRKSEQKPLSLCFLTTEGLQGTRYLSPSSDVALKA